MRSKFKKKKGIEALHFGESVGNCKFILFDNDTYRHSTSIIFCIFLHHNGCLIVIYTVCNSAFNRSHTFIMCTWGSCNISVMFLTKSSFSTDFFFK